MNAISEAQARSAARRPPELTFRLGFPIARLLHAYCTLIARSIARLLHAYEKLGKRRNRGEEKRKVILSFSLITIKFLRFPSFS